MPRRNVVFNAVPRAGDDFAFVNPFDLPLCFSTGISRARDFTFAEWAKLVRAEVGLGVKGAVDVEEADFAAANLHDRPNHSPRLRWDSEAGTS